MATICGKLVNDLIAADCNRLPARGAFGELVLINLKDWKEATITKIGNVISAIALKALAKGVRVEVFDMAVTAMAELSASEIRSSRTHKVGFAVDDKNQDVKDFVNDATNSTVVIITKSKDTGLDGDTCFEVWGGESGLRLSESVFDIQADADKLFTLTFATPEKSKEPGLPLSLYAGALADTQLIFDSLTVAAP